MRARSDNGRLRRLPDLGYAFSLLAPLDNGTLVEVSASHARPVAPVEHAIPIQTSRPLYWRLYLAPVRGWAPAWLVPMLAAVVVSGLLIGALSGAILFGRRRLMSVIARLQARTRALEHKRRPGSRPPPQPPPRIASF